MSRWHGGSHDANIFAQSNVYKDLERGVHGNYIVIGDSGYANNAFTCTPFSLREKPTNANWSAAEKEYQKSIIATRNTVERAFGVMKRRFPVLKFGMQLRRLNLIQKIITVCVVFENICINMGDFDIDELPLHHAIDDEQFENVFVPEEIHPPPAPPRPRRRRRVGGQLVGPPPPPPPNARHRIINVFAQRMAAGVSIPNAEERKLRREIQRQQEMQQMQERQEGQRNQN